ncbi:hypothetical protein [Streptomyces sp. NBC_00467]|uniref:hypothetical protein n=1 Tax=Streptomyces sp. NBC_00467 TaxID=2975752 RepID=UPI002E18A7A7
MHVTYTFTPPPRGSLTRIQVRGDAGHYYRPAAPVMARKVRSSNGKDLRDLERRLSEPPRSADTLQAEHASELPPGGRSPAGRRPVIRAGTSGRAPFTAIPG